MGSEDLQVTMKRAPALLGDQPEVPDIQAEAKMRVLGREGGKLLRIVKRSSVSAAL